MQQVTLTVQNFVWQIHKFGSVEKHYVQIKVFNKQARPFVEWSQEPKFALVYNLKIYSFFLYLLNTLALAPHPSPSLVLSANEISLAKFNVKVFENLG